MKITAEMIKEVQELYYDVAMDGNRTETQQFMAQLETDKLYNAQNAFEELIEELTRSDPRFANRLSDANMTVRAFAENNGFIKGFLYARALLIG